MSDAAAHDKLVDFLGGGITATVGAISSWLPLCLH